MDFFLCLLIAWYFLKNGSEDLVHAVRGTESPRSKRTMHRLKTGQPSPGGRLGDAISTYLADWIHDASTDAKAKRQEIRERRAAKMAETQEAIDDAAAGDTGPPNDRDEPQPAAARDGDRNDAPDQPEADPSGTEGASGGSGTNEQPHPAADAASGPNGFGLGYVAGRTEERERQRWRDETSQPPPRRPEPVQARAERLDSANPRSAAEPPAPADAQDVLDVELVDQPTTAADQAGMSELGAASGELGTFHAGELIALEPPRNSGRPRLRGCVSRVIQPGEEGNEDGMLPRLVVRYDGHFAEYEVDPRQIVRDNLDPRIPAAAHEPCRLCDTGMLRPIADRGIHCDEGDGSAMVDTRCDNSECRVESCHYWALSDEDYRAEFGHDVGELVDEDDPDPDPETPGPTEPRGQQPLATVTPINPITGGSSLSTPTTIRTNGGETVDPHSAMAFADAVGAVGSGLVNELETSIANLVARGVSGEPIAHLQRMSEAAQQLQGNSTAARRYFENHAQIQEVAQSDATVGGGEYLGIGQ